MSYEKLKNIKMKNDIIYFENKSNNDDAPYRKNHCSLFDFVYYSLGYVYQYNNAEINSIITECKTKIEKFTTDNDWWFILDTNNINVIIDDIKIPFLEACDKVNNILKQK